MNIKKKILSAGIVLSFCVASTSLVYAGAVETNTSGGLGLSITDTATGEGFDAAMSPGVVIMAETADNAFALSTANANANPANRIEYGIWSQFSGYYQQTNAATTDPFVSTDMIYNGADGNPADTTDPPFDGTWTAIGDTSSLGS